VSQLDEDSCCGGAVKPAGDEVDPEEAAREDENMKEFRYRSWMVLPHGSYLINLGNPDM